MSEIATPARELLPLRIRTLRQAAGLTVRACATAAGVSLTTWEGWERGRSMPRPWNLDAIARALSAPVAALLVPDGWRALELRLQPSTVERVRAGGLPVAAELAELVDVAGLILQACRVPNRPPHKDGRGKRRRTRAEVLAGIAEAEAMRSAARSRALAEPEAGGGAARDDRSALYGSHAHHPGLGGLSTLPSSESIETAAD